MQTFLKFAARYASQPAMPQSPQMGGVGGMFGGNSNRFSALHGLGIPGGFRNAQYTATHNPNPLTKINAPQQGLATAGGVQQAMQKAGNLSKKAQGEGLDLSEVLGRLAANLVKGAQVQTGGGASPTASNASLGGSSGAGSSTMGTGLGTPQKALGSQNNAQQGAKGGGGGVGGGAGAGMYGNMAGGGNVGAYGVVRPGWSALRPNSSVFGGVPGVKSAATLPPVPGLTANQPQPPGPPGMVPQQPPGMPAMPPPNGGAPVPSAGTQPSLDPSTGQPIQQSQPAPPQQPAQGQPTGPSGQPGAVDPQTGQPVTSPMQDAPPPPLPANPRMTPPRAPTPHDDRQQGVIAGLGHDMHVADQPLNANEATEDMQSEAMAMGSKTAWDVLGAFANSISGNEKSAGLGGFLGTLKDWGPGLLRRGTAVRKDASRSFEQANAGRYLDGSQHLADSAVQSMSAHASYLNRFPGVHGDRLEKLRLLSASPGYGSPATEQTLSNIANANLHLRDNKMLYEAANNSLQSSDALLRQHAGEAGRNALFNHRLRQGTVAAGGLGLGGFGLAAMGKQGADKYAGAAWRSAQGLSAMANRFGLTGGAGNNRLGVLSQARGKLGMGTNLPGVDRKVASLPRATLPTPVQGGPAPSQVYRGHPTSVAPDHRFPDGISHATPHPDLASGYGGLPLPGHDLRLVHGYGVPQTQRYYSPIGMRKEQMGRPNQSRTWGEAGSAKPNEFYDSVYETNVNGMRPNARFLVPEGGNGPAAVMPFTRANNAFYREMSKPASDAHADPVSDPRGFALRLAAELGTAHSISGNEKSARHLIAPWLVGAAELTGVGAGMAGVPQDDYLKKSPPVAARPAQVQRAAPPRPPVPKAGRPPGGKLPAALLGVGALGLAAAGHKQASQAQDGNHDTAKSATGESKGLAFATKDDHHATGKDAWSSVSGYFKGGKGKSPKPWLGKHAGDAWRKYTFDAEDCPKCGASMEGDPYEGTCNGCGYKWGTKAAAMNLANVPHSPNVIDAREQTGRTHAYNAQTQAGNAGAGLGAAGAVAGGGLGRVLGRRTGLGGRRGGLLGAFGLGMTGLLGGFNNSMGESYRKPLDWGPAPQPHPADVETLGYPQVPGGGFDPSRAGSAAYGTKQAMDDCYANGCSTRPDGTCSCEGRCESCNPREKSALTVAELAVALPALGAAIGYGSGALRGRPEATSESNAAVGGGTGLGASVGGVAAGMLGRRPQLSRMGLGALAGGVGGYLGSDRLFGKAAHDKQANVFKRLLGLGARKPPMTMQTGAKPPVHTGVPGFAQRPATPPAPSGTVPNRPVGTPAPAQPQESSAINIAASTANPTPLARINKPQPASHGMPPPANEHEARMMQLTPELYRWFKGGPRTWSAAGLAGLGGLGALGSAKAAAAVDPASVLGPTTGPGAPIPRKPLPKPAAVKPMGNPAPMGTTASTPGKQAYDACSDFARGFFEACDARGVDLKAAVEKVGTDFGEEAAAELRDGLEKAARFPKMYEWGGRQADKAWNFGKGLFGGKPAIPELPSLSGGARDASAAAAYKAMKVPGGDRAAGEAAAAARKKFLEDSASAARGTTAPGSMAAPTGYGAWSSAANAHSGALNPWLSRGAATRDAIGNSMGKAGPLAMSAGSTAMGALGGGMAFNDLASDSRGGLGHRADSGQTDIYGLKLNTAGMWAGAAAFNPWLRRAANRNLGGTGSIPLAAVRGSALGSTAGTGVDSLLGAANLNQRAVIDPNTGKQMIDPQTGKPATETANTFGRIGAWGGMGYGGLRQGVRMAPNWAGGTNQTLAAANSALGRGEKGIVNFATGQFDPLVGAATYLPAKAVNYLAGRQVFNPNFYGRVGSATAPTTFGRRAGRMVGVGALGLGAVGTAHSMAEDKIRGTVRDAIGQTVAEAAPVVGDLADSWMSQHGMLGEDGQFDPMQAANRKGGVAGSLMSGADGIFRSLGMDPSRMSPLQKMMILGGATAGGGGLLAGSPALLGAGGVSALGGMLPQFTGGQGQQGGQQPYQPGMPAMGGVNRPAPNQPAARNEWQHQQQLNG